MSASTRAMALNTLPRMREAFAKLPTHAMGLPRIAGRGEILVL